MKKVYIGVGHGGKDSGAVGNGLKEKDMNLVIAISCGQELARHGVHIMFSRTVDEYETTNSRVAECNSFNPDLALDIHNNAGGGDGAEVFHYSKGGTGKTLAQNIIDEIVNFGQNSRGIKTRLKSNGEDYYAFIRETSCPAVIVECAFIDNAKDIKIIDTKAEQREIGKHIARGVLKTLGIAYVKEEKESEEEKAVKWAIDKGLINDKSALEKTITVKEMINLLYKLHK